MNIYNETPKDWKELQNFTSNFLKEIGYHCETEKDVMTVRGTVNIDVYAENLKTKPSSIIICECKYWNSPIPQTIIHAFRTVMSDIGANHGFIISKKGFQSGAHEATKSTNMTLLTWEEFQNYFRNNWVISMTPIVNKINQDLQTYISAGFRVFFKEEYKNLNPEELSEFERLNMEYFHTAFYSMDHDYKDLETKEFDIKYFEQNIHEGTKIYGRDFISYEDFYEFIISDAKEGVQKFEDLFKGKLRKKNYS